MFRNPHILGIFCVTVAMSMIAFQDALIKWLSGEYPLHQVVLTRSIVGIFITLILVRWEGGWQILRTRYLRLHITRGLLVVVANSAYFAALAALPLSEAMAIFFVAPLFIAALSVPFLGERVGPWRWSSIAVGLVGVVIMLRPGDAIFNFASLLPILAAGAYASMQILTRRLGATEKASVLAFYIQITFIFVSGAIGLAVGDGRFAGGGNASVEFLLRAWVWPPPGDFAIMITCGILVGAIGYLLSQAYRQAEANLIAPFEYIALPMAVFWGYLLWDHTPDRTALMGIILIVGSGLFMLYREVVRNRSAKARHSGL